MNLPQETLDQLAPLVAAGFPHDRIARKVGVSELTVRDYEIRVAKKYFVSEDGHGRPEMRKYIVGMRHVDEPWDRTKYPHIAVERARYDAGLVELATGRDGFNIILYSIPRVNVDKERRAYFSRNFGDG